MRPWQRRAGSQSQAAGGLLSFTAFLPCRIAPPLTAWQYPAHHPSRLSPHTLSHGTILDSSLPSGFLRPCLHLSFLLKDPSYYAPSFVYVHTASLSSWGVRSVHQALCWTLTLIISNSHNELHSKYWPHFTDEEIETK